MKHAFFDCHSSCGRAQHGEPPRQPESERREPMAAPLQHARTTPSRIHLHDRGVLSLRGASLASALAPFCFRPNETERSRAPPTTASLTQPSSIDRVLQTHYLRNKRAERLRRGKASSVSGAMEGGGVAGLAQMRARLSGKSAAYERLGTEDGGESGGGGLRASSSARGGDTGGSVKRTGSGTGATILESAWYIVDKK